MSSTEPSLQVPFFDIRTQYASIREEINGAIEEVLDSGVFVGGPTVRQFEADFASYLGVDACVGVGNGTDALEIALQTLGLPLGSEVLVPANSFVATAEAVVRTGLRPVFVDVDNTCTMDPDSARAAVSPRTSAIIAVHLYGQACDMPALLDISRQHGLMLLEDCAQSHGGTLLGRMLGTFSDAAAFSFYPGKNLGGFGDGGAIVFRSAEHTHLARMIANHGRESKYDHVLVGRNSRLDALQAAILRVKLRHLDTWVQRRRDIADHFTEVFRELPEVWVPDRLTGSEHARHLFVVRVPDRDLMRGRLRASGIETGVHYPSALPDLLPFRIQDEGQPSSCRHARELAASILSLPCNETMSDSQVELVTTSMLAMN